MESEVKISVILAFYNAEKYLRETIKSIINQTLKQIEIICVDDGSQDNSCNIIKEIMTLDQRVKLFFNTVESDGAALARNLGIEKSIGEYLAILDADDIFELDMLECAYNKAKELDADTVIFDGYYYHDTNGLEEIVPFLLNREYVNDLESFTPDQMRNSIFQITVGCAWNKIFRRKMIIDNKIQFRPVFFSDDTEFTCLALLYSELIGILPEYFVHYRVFASNNQTSQKIYHPETGYKTFCYLKNELIKRGLYEKYKRSYVNRMLKYVYEYLFSMRDYENYSILFFELKKRLQDMGAYDISEFEITNLEWVKFRNLIRISCRPEDFLFNYIMNNNDREIRNRLMIPYPARGKKKIILYGAGKIGTNIYNLRKYIKDVEIVAVVDKKAEYIITPKKIKEMDYDYIFIAIDNKDIRNDIKNKLISEDIDIEKII
jgi:glycosyltransferase involved in cell wall biosynthesis